jgi:hypothetical protein
MLLKNGYRFILAATAAGLLASTCAGNVQAGEAQPIPSSGDWQALDHCAVYGPDFTSVAGSDACVRIGGRVRVEFGFRKTPNPYDNDMRVGSHPAVIRSGGSIESPADLPDGVEQGHVRLNGASELVDPYR